MNKFSIYRKTLLMQKVCETTGHAYSEGVYFDEKRKLAVVTQGHLLVMRRITVDEEPPWGKLITFTAIALCDEEYDDARPPFEYVGIPEDVVTFHRAGDTSRFVSEDGLFVAEEHSKADYPEYEKVLAAGEYESQPIMLSAALLRLAEKACGYTTGITIQPSRDPHGPIAFRVGHEHFGCLMPMKREVGDEYKPGEEPEKCVRKLIRQRMSRRQRFRNS